MHCGVGKSPCPNSFVLSGEPFLFTPWGLLSGLFWVPGGTAGIAAVRTAELAASQGTWSTLKILVSRFSYHRDVWSQPTRTTHTHTLTLTLSLWKVAFAWGVFIFDEHVRSRINATMAIVLMMMGLWGMGFFSSPRRSHVVDNEGSSLVESLLSDEDNELVFENEEDITNTDSESKWTDRFTKRQLTCAVIDGVWGGKCVQLSVKAYCFSFSSS